MTDDDARANYDDRSVSSNAGMVRMSNGEEFLARLARLAFVLLAIAVAGGIRPAIVDAQIIQHVITCPAGTQPTYFGCQQEPGPKVTYVKNWGALAMVDPQRDWLIATGYTTEDKAKKGMLAACKKSGQTCRIALTFLNQCVSVARVTDKKIAGPGKDTIHNGSNFETTQADALASCKRDWRAKSCAAVVTQCGINQIER